MSLEEHRVYAQTKAFARHVDTARRIIDEGASKGRLVVAMSWGKDSCAMGHLASVELGPLDMMHMACAHELPGGERVREFFAARGTIHELAPINNLQESLVWLREVGLPHEREHAAHQRIIQTRKRDRGDDWATENGFVVTMLGMRAQESAVRRRLFRARSPTYQKASRRWMCNPLAWWTTRDVWAYLVSRDIPWHPLYDCETLGFTRETLRNGGWLYTDGTDRGWAVWLRKHYPEQWRALVGAFPRMRLHSG